MRKILLSFFICLSGLAAFGQGNDVWSLQRCIAYAHENNLQIKLSELSIQQSEASVKQAKAARHPNLNANVSYGFNFGYSINPLTNTFESNTIHGSNLSLSSNATLYAGGQIRNTMKQTETDLEASQMDREQTKNDLALNIAGAYLQVLFLTEQLENSKLQLQSTQEQKKRTQKLIDAGSLPAANIYDLEAQEASDERLIVDTENQLKLSVLSLKQFLQLPPNTAFEIETPAFSEILDAPELTGLEDIYNLATQSQPSIFANQLRIKSADLGVYIARGARLPTVFLSLNANTRQTNIARSQSVSVIDSFFVEGYLASNPNLSVSLPTPITDVAFESVGFFQQLRQNLGYQISIGVSIPIYNRRTTLTNIERAQIGFENARLNEAINRQTLRQNVERAYLDVSTAYSQYQAVRKQIKALEVSLQNSERQLSLGIMNSTDYLLAKNRLDQARIDLVRAKYDYIFKTKILDFYQGKSISY